jgi:hypothetical protein
VGRGDGPVREEVSAGRVRELDEPTFGRPDDREPREYEEPLCRVRDECGVLGRGDASERPVFDRAARGRDEREDRCPGRVRGRADFRGEPREVRADGFRGTVGGAGRDVDDDGVNGKSPVCGVWFGPARVAAFVGRYV